jgi:hypothetical protein
MRAKADLADEDNDIGAIAIAKLEAIEVGDEEAIDSYLREEARLGQEKADASLRASVLDRVRRQAKRHAEREAREARRIAQRARAEAAKAQQPEAVRNVAESIAEFESHAAAIPVAIDSIEAGIRELAKLCREAGEELSAADDLDSRLRWYLLDALRGRLRGLELPPTSVKGMSVSEVWRSRTRRYR